MFSKLFLLDEKAALIQPTTSANKRKLDPHSGKKRKNTKYCQYTADCKYSGTIIGLKNHKKAEHETKETPCLYAGCNFSATPSGLKNHRKLKHKVKCPLANCKFVGTPLLALKDHTRAKHGPEVSGPPKNALAKKGSQVGVFELGSGNCYCIVNLL